MYLGKRDTSKEKIKLHFIEIETEFLVSKFISNFLDKHIF